MSDVISYKCPNCGAPIRFAADTGKFLCDYCDSSFTLEEVKNASVNADKPFDWGDYQNGAEAETLEGTVSYVCQSCGAEILTDAVTAATHCPYCGNVVIVQPNVSGLIKPNGVIPFKVDKKQLSDIVQQYCRGKKKLLPKRFLTENQIEEVQGIYVPFWLYDCRADGDMAFDATKVRSWSDSRYNYTETSYYLVTCDGSMRFEKIPVDGSIKMDDALMDSLEPFDYSAMEDFAPGYLSGFLADRFDNDAEDCLPRATVRVKNSVAEVFKEAVSGGFTTMVPTKSNIGLADTSVKYVLLPVYLISSKYDGKFYQFAVNGQTGKAVGNLPISKGKTAAWFAGLTAGFAALFTVLAALFLA